jgi:hypothetical protein
MSNHAHRFFAAVSVMAGHGNIKQRLIQAYEENLAVIDDHDLPIVIRQAFAELRDMMSQVAPLNGEGRVRASVRKMSVGEADACAQRMLAIYGDIIRLEDSDDDFLPLQTAEKAPVPPFLVKSN